MSQRYALVTGGTRGIGRAISLRLARDGYHVLALYGRNRETADALTAEAQREGLTIETLRGDLTKAETLEVLVNEIRAKAPSIDVLIHSAASGVHRPASELSLKHMRWTFEINVFAIHALLTALLDRIPRGGRVIGVTSAGGTRTIPFYAAVGASKGALEALFRHYAAEFAPRGINVNLICPGLVPTDAVDAFPDRDDRLRRVLEWTPTGRLTTPENVADTAAFLCSPAADQIVGQTFVIDGGKTLSS